MFRLKRSPIRMCLKFPRLADVAAVKRAVCDIDSKMHPQLERLEPGHLGAVELVVSVSPNRGSSYGDVARFLDDKTPLANLLESTSVNGSSPLSPSSSPTASTYTNSQDFTLLLSENCKHLGFVASLSLARLNNKLAVSDTSADTSPEMGPYEDHLEYARPDQSEGYIVTDIDNLVIPGRAFTFEDLVIGRRVDALDHRGQW